MTNPIKAKIKKHLKLGFIIGAVGKSGIPQGLGLCIPGSNPGSPIHIFI